MIVSMGTTTTALMTFEEFAALPDQPGKMELLEGELIELPVAAAKHTKMGIYIYRTRLNSVFPCRSKGLRGEAAELGEAYHEIGYKLAGARYFQPDASVTHAGQRETRCFEGSPAIAIEVVSPSNTALEYLDRKIRLTVFRVRGPRGVGSSTRRRSM